MTGSLRRRCIGPNGLLNSRLWHVALSELLGTFLLVSLGLSAAATAAVSAPATAQLGSGLALIVALYVAMGASGGHINPAVSTALFVVKKMKLVDFIVYQLAQYIGGILAAVLVCCFFYPPLLDYVATEAVGDEQANLTTTVAPAAALAAAAAAHAAHVADATSSLNGMSPATAEMEAIYITHAHQSVSLWRALTSEVYASGAFILAIRGITDSRSPVSPPMHLQPPMIAATVLAMTQCTAPLSGCSLNPARDLPSRMVVAVFQLAVDGKTTGLFSLGGNTGFVAPMLGPYLGAAVGSWLYELCITRALVANDNRANSLGSSPDDNNDQDDGKNAFSKTWSDDGDSIVKPGNGGRPASSQASSFKQQRQQTPEARRQSSRRRPRDASEGQTCQTNLLDAGNGNSYPDVSVPMASA